MKSGIRVIICFLIAVKGMSIHISAEEKALLIDGANDEAEMYTLLMEHTGHEILEEYIIFENEGASELIPYACALADKSDEFERDELIQLILDQRTLGETESVLTEMLHKKGTDFNKLTYIQNDATVALNTKQLLLQSDTVDTDFLVKTVYESNDFRAKTAMQQIGFRDKTYVFELSKDLLFNYETSYYRMAAINIGMNLYYQTYPDDERDKEAIANKLLSIYNTSEDEQIRFWAIDTLGWMHYWEIFCLISSDQQMDALLKSCFFNNSKEYIKTLLVDNWNEKNNDYLKECAKWIQDEEVRKVLYEHNIDVSEEDLSDSVTSLPSSFIGYAVYRDGVFFNYFEHAAIMNVSNVNNTSNQVVIHAPGGNVSVCKASWSGFKDVINNFVVACKPNNCAMTTSQRSAFQSKASSLIGTPYTLGFMMVYTVLNDGSKIEPTIITNIRCDGVVEYVYEYYGFRVAGGNTNWNISLNYTSNYNGHAGLTVSPQTQHLYYLTAVTTSETDLY